MKSWFRQNLNWFAFVLGFAYDFISLHGRMGDFSFASLIFYLTLFQIALFLRNLKHEKCQKISPWLGHFCMGSLFSALAILYLRSSPLGLSLVASILFAGGLFLNEWKWSKQKKFSVPLILNPLLSSAMLAFLLPHFTGSPEHRYTWMAFGLGGFIGLLQWALPLWRSKIQGFPLSSLFWAGFGIYIYSGHFPSLPLVPQEFYLAQSKSSKFGGECPRHSFGLWPTRDTLDPRKDQEVYFFTSIYSPEKLSASLVQNWYYLKNDQWILAKSVKHEIHGGREKGFRLWGGYIRPDYGTWKLEIAIPGYSPLLSKVFELAPREQNTVQCRLP